MWRDWEQAWAQALYGPAGFVRSGQRPVAHYRTSVHVGGLLAEAVVELLARTDTALDHPQTLDVVDLGAGGGELLAGLHEQAPARLRARLRPLGVDVRPAPDGWDLGWRAALPAQVHGLVVAHEWLDALACPVVVHDGVTVRRVQVDDSGAQRRGPAAAGAELAWLRRWGSLRAGERSEVGAPRDQAWATVLRSVVAGAALAIDYGHQRTGDTLAAYRGGRQVRPVPDGSCDLTAHVFWPSVVAVAGGAVLPQAQALAKLGVTAATPAAVDPWGWLSAAERAGQLAELSDPDGLGAFGWLLVEVGDR